MIKYIDDFLSDFILNKKIKIKKQVGYDKYTIDFKNMNNFPIVVAEDINFSIEPNYTNVNIGNLSFSLSFFSYNSKSNDYLNLQKNFLTPLKEYLMLKNELIIKNIVFDTDNDNVYILNIELTNEGFII